MKLAPNFTLAELTTTSHRRYVDANQPPPDLLFSGRLLAAELQKVRDHFGQPVMVHSGYRCLGLNTAIGGSRSSQHMTFEAADFHVVGVSLGEVFEWIRKSDIDYSQVILEGWTAGKPSWIHLGINGPAWKASGKAVRQVLSFDGTRYYRIA